MTCQEIRTRIENGAQMAEEMFPSDSRLAAHVASCAECSQFVRKYQNIVKSLELLRTSAGPIPASLDAAVLAGYRRFIAERKTMPQQHLRKAYLPFTLRWTAVAVPVLIAAAIALYFTRKPTATVAVPPAQTASAAVIPQTEAPQPQALPTRRVVAPVRRHSAPPGVHPATPMVASISDDFRGLIYCDELSCSGAMDMIRVQLPSAMIARPTSAFRPTSGPVTADVLIGADGIARGIRIEGREF